MPRVAFAESFQNEEKPFAGAVFSKSLQCVVGTRWVKATTISKPRTDNKLVSLDKNSENLFH